MERRDLEQIAGAYDRWSERYDAQANATRDLDELVLRRIVPDLSGKTVVECGCGTGKNSLWLAPRCGRLIGMDFSEGMLRIAREKVQAPGVSFLIQDITLPWPLENGGADVVLFNLVLEHIEDLNPVFAQAARVLRQGGLMALSEYHPLRVAAGKGPVLMDDDGNVSQRIPNYLHTRADYFDAASDAGLELESEAEWTESELYSGEPDLPAETDPRPQLISMVFRKP